MIASHYKVDSKSLQDSLWSFPHTDNKSNCLSAETPLYQFSQAGIIAISPQYLQVVVGWPQEWEMFSGIADNNSSPGKVCQLSGAATSQHKGRQSGEQGTTSLATLGLED